MIDLEEAIQAIQEAQGCSDLDSRHCEEHDAPAINGECYGIDARTVLEAAMPHLGYKIAAEIHSQGMISRLNLDPYWTGWDDAIDKATEIVEGTTK